MNAAQQIAEHAKVLVDVSLVEGCREIAEWKETGILVESGVVRRIAEVLRPLATYNSLSVTLTMFQDAAVKHVAATSSVP